MKIRQFLKHDVITTADLHCMAAPANGSQNQIRIFWCEILSLSHISHFNRVYGQVVAGYSQFYSVIYSKSADPAKKSWRNFCKKFLLLNFDIKKTLKPGTKPFQVFSKKSTLFCEIVQAQWSQIQRVNDALLLRKAQAKWGMT